MKPSFREQIRELRGELHDVRQTLKVLQVNYTKLITKFHVANKANKQYTTLIYAMSQHLGPYSEGQLTTEQRVLLYDIKDAESGEKHERWWVEEEKTNPAEPIYVIGNNNGIVWK